MLLIPNGLGPPSQTAHENQITVRSGDVSETAFLSVFDAAVLKRAGRGDGILAETLPEAPASGDPKDVGKAIAPTTEGVLESTSTGDMPEDTPTADATGPHTHTTPILQDTAPARIRQNPQSSQPVMPHAVNPAPMAAKAPGRDVAQSASLATVANPPTMSHPSETNQQRPWPKDPEQAKPLPKPSKVNRTSMPVDVFETGSRLRPAAAQAASINTVQGTVSSTPLEDRPPTPDTGGIARSNAGQAMPADHVAPTLPAAAQAASINTVQGIVSSTPLEDRPPTPDTGGIARSNAGQAIPAERVAPILPAAAQEAKTTTRPVNDKATPFNTETSEKNRADPPQPRQSGAYPPPQATAPPQAGATPPTPTAAPMQTTAAPVFKAELTEESLRSPVSHDDARSDLRLTAEGGPRPAGPLSQAPQSPDLPRHIAQQIVEALQRGGGGKERGIDLLLNPAELGRVRISLSPGDAGLTVNIVADRPETLDLMRRNIDMLAQDFQSIGYDTTDFAFAHHGHDEEDQGRNAPQKQTPHVTQEAEAPSRVTAKVDTDRVDIRL